MKLLIVFLGVIAVAFTAPIVEEIAPLVKDDAVLKEDDRPLSHEEILDKTDSLPIEKENIPVEKDFAPIEKENVPDEKESVEKEILPVIKEDSILAHNEIPLTNEPPIRQEIFPGVKPTLVSNAHELAHAHHEKVPEIVHGLEDHKIPFDVTLFIMFNGFGDREPGVLITLTEDEVIETHVI